MNKYTALEDEVFKIFSSIEWKGENIKTFPKNISMKDAGKNFIRIDIVPSSNYVNSESISGVLIIDIFITAGQGSTAAYTIADTLDKYLNYKVYNHRLQFSKSSLQPLGNDPADSGLYTYQYIVSFNFFGAL